MLCGSHHNKMKDRIYLKKISNIMSFFKNIFLCQRKTAISISCRREYTEGATLAEEELKKCVACVCIPSTYSHRSISASFMFMRERSFQFSLHQCQEYRTCFLIWCPDQQRDVMRLWLPEPVQKSKLLYNRAQFGEIRAAINLPRSQTCKKSICFLSFGARILSGNEFCYSEKPS